MLLVAGVLIAFAPVGSARGPALEPEDVFQKRRCHGDGCEPCNVPGFYIHFIGHTLVTVLSVDGKVLVSDQYKKTYGLFLDVGSTGGTYQIVSGVSFDYDWCWFGTLKAT